MFKAIINILFIVNVINSTDPNLFTYKVAMGACLGLAALMLFTLVFVLLCFLIHRQRRISQGTHLYCVL